MTTLPPGLTLRRADGIDELDVRTFYKLAQLRERVFVVEQECPYLELDGRDLEPGAIQLWAEAENGDIAATVRILRGRITNDPTSAPRSEADAPRVIGRVVTAPAWRGTGVASALMEIAVTECRGSAIELDAQSHLIGWYGRFGFIPAGEEFLDDGIPHTPMRRELLLGE